MTLQKLIKNIEKEQLKTELTPIQIGDTVKVVLIIFEDDKKGDKKGDKEAGKEPAKKKRIQPYEGTIIAQHRAGINTTITVRRIFQNIGIERVFNIHSPLIKNIEVIRRAKVRKAKLYYLRTRIGKSTRLKERFN